MTTEPDSRLLPLLETVSFRPVFIIGDHRSGTTLLYKILSETGCFHVVTAYHVIHYGEILSTWKEGRETEAKRSLASRFDALGLSNRVIDNMPVTPDAPEEYGFVLEDSRRPQVRPANRERMVEICRKIRLIGETDKPVLLKNPWDVLSFVYLQTCFPDAKFVFLQRHPLGVINSQLRAIRSLVASRNEYVALIARWYERMSNSPAELAWMRTIFSSRLPFWKRIVPRHVLRANRYFAENIASIPAENRFSLRYEDLCKKPRSTMENLLDFIGVNRKENLAYESIIKPRDPELLPEIEHSRNEILHPFQPYLKLHGYQ